VRRCFLDIAERHASIEGGGDEAVTERVRANSLVDPGGFRQSPHDPGCSVAIEAACPVGVEEDRSAGAFTDVQVERCRRTRGGRDRGGLVSLAVHEQRAMSALILEILDLGAECLGDPQPVQRQPAHQRMVPPTAQTGLDQEGAELVSIKPEGMGLVADLRAAHVRGRVAIDHSSPAQPMVVRLVVSRRAVR